MDDNESNEPDILRGFSVAEILDSLIENADNENAHFATLGYGKDPRPELCVLQSLIKALAREDYEERLEEYNEKEDKLNKIYGDPVERGYVLDSNEASQRLMNTRFLMKDIGFMKIDEKYAYYAQGDPDTIDFKDWDDKLDK